MKYTYDEIYAARTDTPSERDGYCTCMCESKRPCPRHPKPEPVTPNAELIRAMLDGKTVQVRNRAGSAGGQGPWYTYKPRRTLEFLVQDLAGHEFRLKPEPLVRWAPVCKEGFGPAQLTREKACTYPWHTTTTKVLRLELDPDTLDVISASTEAP